MIMVKNIISMFRNKLLFERNKRAFLQQFTKKKQKIILLDTPTHSNIGDSMISIAELKFLRSICGETQCIVEVNQDEFELYYDQLYKLISEDDLLILHGGGNLGNLWLHHEKTRRKIISSFPENTIILMPQSCYFTNNQFGRNEQRESQKVYNSHSKLFLFAREIYSLGIMKELFDVPVYLTPDIVLSTEMLETKHIRDGILFCMRNDAEKRVDAKKIEQLARIFDAAEKKVRYTDMVFEDRIVRNKRKQIVAEKLEMFGKSEFVVTDRMHGMIFAYLTGTPCAVFENSNHKIRGTYEWLQGCGYIKLFDDMATATDVMNFFKSSKEINYLKFDVRFDLLKNLVTRKMCDR